VGVAKVMQSAVDLEPTSVIGKHPREVRRPQGAPVLVAEDQIVILVGVGRLRQLVVVCAKSGSWLPKREVLRRIVSSLVYRRQPVRGLDPVD
jgi:hypothetical protein